MGNKKQILEARIISLINDLVDKSKELKEKNAEIAAGIKYAQKIQKAYLPPLLENTFAVYMPKDIVSGDFYWMNESNKLKIIAMVDCTGHGVPGAFISIAGFTSLNKIILREQTTSPGEILNQLNQEINLFLQQGLDDGMDISIVAFNDNILNYAAGNHSIYLVRNGQIEVFKGQRYGIGLTTLEMNRSFMNLSFNIQPNDMIYMCTDGCEDQFNFNDTKKFGTTNIKRIISQIWNLSLEEQKQIVQTEILDWKGDQPQTDDITFIGIRI